MTIHHGGTLPFVSSVHKKKPACKEELLENVVLCKKEAITKMLSDDFELVSKHFVMIVSSGHVQMWPQREKPWLHLCHCLMVFFESHPTCHLIKAQADLAFHECSPLLTQCVELAFAVRMANSRV